ncbi:MAG: heavy metal-associated domain-containing protein [Neisseria sp.]|nr:heavy metal-associated domain-containing protein [Neisseria sp.]
MNTVTLNISGMTCNGCSASIQRVLLAVEGVNRVETDWQHGRAEIEFDANQTNTAILIEAVEDAGFDAETA